MERRSFLSRASVGAGVGATLIAAPAITRAALPAVRWRCAQGFPAALDTVFGSSVDTAKRISDATDGRFQITIAPPGEIVPMPGIVDAVAGGVVECGYIFPGWYVGQDPAWSFGAVIPFGMNFRQMNAWWFHGGGRAMYNDWLRPRGMQYILAGNTGAQMGGWFRREIRTPADVKGLRFRIAGLGGNVWAAAGAVPQQIAGGEIYSALERGTIDAAEFIGPHDDERLGFHRVARFYYHPGWWEGNSGLGWLISSRAWDALPAEYRQIFTAAAHEGIADLMARYDARNTVALRRLIAGGVQLRGFPRPVLQMFWEHAQKIYAELNAANPNFKRLYESYTGFQRDVVGWKRLTENSFDSLMADVLRPARPAAGGGEPPRKAS